jgi:hypothetical protein
VTGTTRRNSNLARIDGPQFHDERSLGGYGVQQSGKHRSCRGNGRVTVHSISIKLYGETRTEIARVWDRLFHLYNYRREEFLEHYHKRSNVEATFSSIKRVFGDFIRSKTPTAQINEARLKVLAHNVVTLVHSIFELGIASMLERSQIAEPMASGEMLGLAYPK